MNQLFRGRGFSGLVAAAAVGALSALGAAQCLDFGDGIAGQANGTVKAMITFDEDGAGPLPSCLYIGGDFTQVGGVPANGIARWNGTEWSAMGAGVRVVYSLAVFDDGTGPALYAGGTFSPQPAAPANIAKWNGAAWTNLGAGVTGVVYALAVYNDGSGPALFAAGSLSSAGGASTDAIASWNGSGWRTWNAGPSSRNLVSAVYDPVRQNVIIAGGRLNGGSGNPSNETWTLAGSSWSRVSNLPGGVSDYRAVFDTVRSRAVLMGSGGNMFTYNGAVWAASSIQGFPTDRDNYQVAYDSARDRLVAFGGAPFWNTSSYQNDTWECNGTAWTQRTTAAAPPGRVLQAMCYDPVRQRTVLFGGVGSAGRLGDTWEYDGTTWTQVATTGPSPRERAGMTFDSLRNRVILYGGLANQQSRETWSWNGAAWTLLDLGSVSWGSRANNPITYDALRDKVVQRDTDGRTWLFDGTTWTQQLGGGLNGVVNALEVHNDGTGPALYATGAFTQAGGQPADHVARLTGAGWSAVGAGVGGAGAASLKSWNGALYAAGDGSAVRRWDGAAWATLPSYYGTLAVGDDGSGASLFISGAPGTGYPMARLVGNSWVPVLSQATPGSRVFPAMGHDAVRGRTILFGGAADLACTQPLGTTYEWNGRAWTQVSAGGPSARWGAAMAFDSTSGQLVLVGGGGSLGDARSDTWTWDGSAWTQLSSSFGPGGRLQHAVAFDTARGRLVLFGGRSSSGIYSDTWEWDGATWTQRATSGPGPRYAHAMAYDPQRGRTVLIGGYNIVENQLVQLRGTWEWDGNTWVQASDGATNYPGPIVEASAFYNSDRREVMLYGGQSGTFDAGKIWSWNGSAWTEVASSGYGRALGAVYNSTLQRIVAHGGMQYFNQLQPFTTIIDNAFSVTPVGHGTGTFTCMAPYNGALAFGGAMGLPPSQRVVTWPASCTPPTIVNQPAAATAQYGSSVTFSVDAKGTSPLVYTWRRNGVPLFDQANFRSGSRTRQLVLSSWSFNDAGTYDCVISNPVGTVVTTPRTLTVDGSTVNGPVEVTRVVYPPDAAPGAGGATYSLVMDPLIAPTGEVLFAGDVVGGNRMLAMWEAGELSKVAKVVDAPPSAGSDQFIEQFNYWGVLPGGRAWYTADLFGPGISITNRRGMWYHDHGATTLIARAGEQAPGFPQGQVFTKYTEKFVGASDAQGNLRFGSWVDFNNDRVGFGMFAWTPGGTPTVLARSGDSAPGTATTFNAIDILARGTAGGDTIFSSTLTGGGSGSWRSSGGVITPVTLPGDQVPGEPTGTLWSSPGVAIVNDQDAVCYVGTWSGPGGAFRMGIAVKGENGDSVLVKTSDPVPGRPDGTTFQGLQAWDMNDLGEVLFQSTFAGVTCPPPECPNAGLFLHGLDGLHTIILERSAPPSGVPSAFTEVAITGPGAVNASGQVIFGVSVGSPTLGNNPAVFGWTRDHGVFPIVVPGTQMEVRPGLYKTVLSAYLTPRFEGPSLGTANLLETGRMVMRVTFTDNSSGIFTGQFGSFLNGRFPCVALASPVAQSAAEGGVVTLEAAPTGAGLAYEWRKDGTTISSDPRYSGLGTPVLTISPVTPVDAGVFTCVVSGAACGALTTNAATLEVVSRCGTSDFNGDGDFGTDQDIEAFFACLGGNCCQTCWFRGADFNGDGDYGTDQDIEAFFRVLGGGGC